MFTARYELDLHTSGQSQSTTLRFPILSVIPHHTDLHLHVSLARRINGENWEPSTKHFSFGNREALD